MKLIILALYLLTICLPVSAADVGDVNGAASDPTLAAFAAVSDPVDLSDPTEAPVSVHENETVVAALADDGMLAGGYYFVCDCALGYDLTFYVPLEWAHDVFTYDSSGDLVNLSTSTCYAYCPSYPDYTFSASRFGNFTYRSGGNYNSQDLKVTDISDTNMTFFVDAGIALSDTDLAVLSCCLLFIVAAILIIRRG